jgi:hypothetical protein|tara:strand:- start:603 stop:875 length:273 start_codon:yes stop_codon:yes gene_type:complete
MAEIVQPHVIETSPCPNAPPRLLHVDQGSARHVSATILPRVPSRCSLLFGSPVLGAIANDALFERAVASGMPAPQGRFPKSCEKGREDSG